MCDWERLKLETSQSKASFEENFRKLLWRIQRIKEITEINFWSDRLFDRLFGRSFHIKTPKLQPYD